VIQNNNTSFYLLYLSFNALEQHLFSIPEFSFMDNILPLLSEQAGLDSSFAYNQNNSKSR